MKSLIHLSLICTGTLVLLACAPRTIDRKQALITPATGVIGGQKVKAGSKEIYSTVGIYDRSEKFLCTGTLISRSLVLTAGHCIGRKPKDMVVFFTESIDSVTLENTRAVIDAKAHDDYDGQPRKNMADIGLLKMEFAPLPRGYGPAELLADTTRLKEKASFTAVGYGVNWSWVAELGAGIIRSVQLNIDDPQFTKTEVLVAQSLTRGICLGDSGGPGYMNVDGRLQVWGVASRGDSLYSKVIPDCFIYSVYTRVDAYLPWIHKTAEELNKLHY